jgi:hypothetical protein
MPDFNRFKGMLLERAMTELKGTFPKFKIASEKMIGTITDDYVPDRATIYVDRTGNVVTSVVIG